jgi:hypothetical protein
MMGFCSLPCCPTNGKLRTDRFPDLKWDETGPNFVSKENRPPTVLLAYCLADAGTSRAAKNSLAGIAISLLPVGRCYEGYLIVFTLRRLRFVMANLKAAACRFSGFPDL